MSDGGKALVELRLQLPELLVPDAWALTREFFTTDPSSVGSNSYDDYIRAGDSPPDRIVEDDIHAINRTMRARSSIDDWAGLIGRRLPELADVDPQWDLIAMPPGTWHSTDALRRIPDLFATVTRHHIRSSRATKVLHIKRPHLIPLCDSYVLAIFGVLGTEADGGAAYVAHLREQGRRNYLLLKDVQTRLGGLERPIDRTLVRILDALVWGSHPSTWLGKQ